jgi:flagellar basal body rod protein FlgG
MIYGLYLSAQGADAQSKRLETISNNLANVGTTAFKRDLAIFQANHSYDVEHGSYHNVPNGLEQSTGGIELADIATDFSGGSLSETGGTYDVALAGPGFLRVSHGGENLLTRNGRLTVNEIGELVTADTGAHVMSAGGGRITISPDASDVDIAADGSVVQVDSTGTRAALGQLDIVLPDSLDELQKVGGSLYRAGGDVRPAGAQTQVRQGHLEASGTQSVTEMMQMIQASRAYETNINMMKFQDEALSRLLGSAVRR